MNIDLKMDNISVTPRNRTTMGASFTASDARYHVWFNPDTMELIAPILYKNPLVTSARTFRTRKLNAEIRTNAAIVDRLLRAVTDQKLVEAARAKIRLDDERVAREQHVNITVRAYWAAIMRREPDASHDELEFCRIANLSLDEFRAASMDLASLLKKST